MLSVIAFTALTAIASAAHGGNYAPKGLVMLMHCIAAYMFCGLWFAPAAVAWWFLFRRGKHAIAELDYLTGKGGLDAVQDAYIWPIGFIMPAVIVRCKTRRQQEFFGAFITAPVVGFLALLGGLIYA